MIKLFVFEVISKSIFKTMDFCVYFKCTVTLQISCKLNKTNENERTVFFNLTYWK